MPDPIPGLRQATVVSANSATIMHEVDQRPQVRTTDNVPDTQDQVDIRKRNDEAIIAKPNELPAAQDTKTMMLVDSIALCRRSTDDNDET